MCLHNKVVVSILSVFCRAAMRELFPLLLCCSKGGKMYSFSRPLYKLSYFNTMCDNIYKIALCACINKL